MEETDPAWSQVSLFPVTALLLSAHKGGGKQTHREARQCRQLTWKDSSMLAPRSSLCEGPRSLGAGNAPESLAANPPRLLLMT